MKFLSKMKDGGSESTVTGYWLIEIKSLFSVVLLKFEGRSRQAYHTHAFNCLNWLLRGKLTETFVDGKPQRHYSPSPLPFAIKRSDFHKVDSDGTSWLLSIRGPWSEQWKEYLVEEDRYRNLTNGRVEV